MLLTAHKVRPVLECLDLEGGERLGQCHILVLTACLAAATLTLWVQGVMHNDISPGNVTVSMDPLGAGDSARFPLIDGGGATMHDPSMTVMSLDHYWLHYSTVVSLHYSSSQVLQAAKGIGNDLIPPPHADLHTVDHHTSGKRNVAVVECSICG